MIRLACYIDVMKGFVDDLGPTNVAAIVTDNASNMLKARALLVALEGYGHIIPIRCGSHTTLQGQPRCWCSLPAMHCAGATCTRLRWCWLPWSGTSGRAL